MNRAILIGRLTADPELKTTPSGVPVARFTIAVDRKYKEKNGDRKADFLYVVAWRQLGELCARYLAKGRRVGVEGSIQSRSYEDQEGYRKYVTEIVAENVEFLEYRDNGRSESGEYAAPNDQQAPTGGMQDGEEDELPF